MRQILSAERIDAINVHNSKAASHNARAEVTRGGEVAMEVIDPDAEGAKVVADALSKIDKLTTDVALAHSRLNDLEGQPAAARKKKG